MNKNQSHLIKFIFQKMRWYCMVGTPFILFYIIGMIFQSSLDYLLKLVAFVAIYLAIYSANHFVFDERLFDVLPMSIYLATKVIAIFYTLFERALRT